MLNDDDEPKGKLPVKVAAFCADHQGDSQDSLLTIASELNELPNDLSAVEKVGAILGNCTWSNVLYHEPGLNGA